MSMSAIVQSYLEQRQIPYHLRHHPYTETAMRSAFAARVPAHRVAKGVLLRDDEGFVMAVVPSDRQVDLGSVNARLNRILAPASQRDVKLMFGDCEAGAVPTLGQAYNLKVIWDDQLAHEELCYLESGDHTELLELDKAAFMMLMQNQNHGLISH